MPSITVHLAVITAHESLVHITVYITV